MRDWKDCVAIFGKYNLQHVSVINGKIKRCVRLPLHMMGTKLTGKILGEYHSTLGSVMAMCGEPQGP